MVPEPHRIERRKQPQNSNDSDPFGLVFSRLVRVSGLIITFYEVLFENVDRPYVLALAGTMMSGSLLADAIIKRGKD